MQRLGYYDDSVPKKENVNRFGVVRPPYKIENPLWFEEAMKGLDQSNPSPLFLEVMAIVKATPAWRRTTG